MNAPVRRGDRIELLSMGEDPSPIQPGALGVVVATDGLGTVHVRWDDGRRLGLLPDVDSYAVLPNADRATLRGDSRTATDSEGDQR